MGSRRWAVRKVERWWKAQMALRKSAQTLTTWKVLKQTPQVLRALSSVKPVRATQLILLARTVVEHSADACSTASKNAMKALWEAGDSVAAEEREYQRRQQG